jgi:serine/threonine-protein kinase
MTTRPDPFIGKHVDDRYRLVEKIGAGGFGAVYKAEHLRLGAPFAIKFLFPMLAQDDRIVARFEREARTTSQLHHPHIVDVVDFGEEPTLGLYLVMEFLPGETLRQRVRRDGARDAATILRIADQICDAFTTAHNRGVIHRDLKPANIFLLRTDARDDFVKVLDFGIAGLANDGGQGLTRSGVIMGSPPYMSPEQAWARKLDHRTDIYSFGVVLYEMATGKTPFRGESDVEILDKQRNAAPEPPRCFRPDLEIPVGLEKVILRCLGKAPEDRYPSMAAVRRDLAELAVSLGLAVPASVVAPGGDEDRDEFATTMSSPARERLATTSRDGVVPPPAATGSALQAPPVVRPPAPHPVPAPAPRRGPWTPIVAAVGAAVVIGGVLALLLPGTPGDLPGSSPSTLAAPAESAPAESAPAESAPAESAPAESAPAAPAPAAPAPAAPAPAAPAPAAPAPAEPAPAAPAPAAPAPAEPAPAEPAPAEPTEAAAERVAAEATPPDDTEPPDTTTPRAAGPDGPPTGGPSGEPSGGPPAGHAAAPPAEPAPAHLVLRTRPAGATVYRGQDELCRTPCDLRLPATGAAERLRIELPGYKDDEAVVTLVAGAEIDRELGLKRARRAGGTTARDEPETTRPALGALPGIRVDDRPKDPMPPALPRLRVE